LSCSTGLGGRDLSREERYGWSETSDMMTDASDFQFLISKSCFCFFDTMTTHNVEEAGTYPTASESLKDTNREIDVVEADIAKLALLLSPESDNNGDDADVSKLLGRLENANGMAQGVEDKLDHLLEKLDGLLASLETKGELEKISEVAADESA
jgi:hypothetical protein